MSSLLCGFYLFFWVVVKRANAHAVLTRYRRPDATRERQRKRDQGVIGNHRCRQSSADDGANVQRQCQIDAHVVFDR